MRPIAILLATTWIGLWLTPDQHGQRLMRQEKFSEAAETFIDPMWKGTAWYRAGEFAKATEAFSRLSTAEAAYNQGNAWLMLGKYDKAVAAYGDALQKRPGWKEAEENRDLAAARARMVAQQGGDMGDQKIGADEIVFDKSKKPGGEETEIAGDQVMSDAAIQSLWLRQVQTQPSDFLKAKFRYQHSFDEQGAAK